MKKFLTLVILLLCGSAWSQSFNLVPATPSKPLATQTELKVTISWLPIKNANRYYVLPIKDGVAQPQIVAASPFEYNATAGAGYQLKVKACNELYDDIGPVEPPPRSFSATNLNSASTSNLGITPSARGQVCSAWSAASDTLSFPQVPRAPSGLDVSNNGNEVNLKWSAVSSANRYWVQISDSNSQWLKEQSVTDNEYSAKLSYGVSYVAKVKSCNLSGCSQFQAVKSFTVPNLPPANTIGSLDIDLFVDRIMVSWNPVSGATTYKIQRFPNPIHDGSEWTLPYDTQGKTNYSMTGFPGNKYRFRVAACNEAGCSNYVESSEVVLAPLRPTNIWLTAVDSAVLLEWTISQTSTSYRLKLLKDGVTQYEQELTGYDKGLKRGVLTPINIKKIDNLNHGSTYTFQIKACNSGGCSDYSESSSITLVPAKPGNIQLSNLYKNITAIWPSSNGATYYTAEQFLDGQWGEAKRIDGDNTKVYFTGKSGHLHRYRVKACNSAGCSDWTLSAELTLPPDIPSISFDRDQFKFLIYWTEVFGATSYRFQQELNGSWQEEVNMALKLSAETSGAEGDKFRFRVRACNSGGCSDFSPETDVSMASIFDPDSDFVDSLPSVAAVSPPAESISSTKVQTVVGELFVTNQGAATYAIPLELLKGIGGFKPELTLGYSSLDSSGDAGLGWSLSAVSSISRCQKVLEEDGVYQGITFTNSDALCLGGEKLRLVSGSNLTSGAEYRLDKHPEVKVVQGSSGAGAYFTVYRPNGDMISYGDNSSSVQIDSVSGMPYTWLQSASVNLFNQKIEYQYQRQQDYAPLLQYILYAGNQVEVVYEDRPDASTHYYLGNKLIYNSRIADIIIRNHSNQAIRSYHLGYKQSGFSDRSLLQTVQMCNGTSSGVCSLVTQLNYSDYDYAGLQSQEIVINLSSYSVVAGQSNCTKRDMYGNCPAYKLEISDFDDNGKRELFASSLSGETGKIFAFEFTGQSYSYQAEKSELNVDLKPFRYYRNLEPIVYHFPWRLVDTNGDGIKEINYGYRAYYDWDGDGVDEVSPSDSTTALEEFEQENTYSGDFATDYYVKFYGLDRKLSDFIFDYNGDGLIDRAVPVHFYREMYDPATGETPAEFVTDDFVIELNQSVGQSYAGVLVPYSGSKYIDNYELSGDLNGDGITDYQTVGGAKYIKTGRNFANASISFDTAPGDCGPITGGFNNCLEGLADLNGDGKDDIVYVHQKKIYWKPSLSSSAASPELLGSVTWPIRQTDPYVWADLDGDDQSELIYFDVAAQKIHIRFDRNTNNDVLDKLISVENGLGKDYAIEYRRLNDPQVYQKGTGAALVNWGSGSKVRDIVSTMPVVAKVTEVTGLSQSGQPLNKEIKYSYKGMKTQAGGRGALGFAEVTTEDITANTKTIKYFRQDSPYNGLLRKSEIFVDGLLAEQTTVSSWWNLASSNSQSHFIAPRKQQTDKYYLNADYGDISSNVAASTTVAETTYEMTAYNYPVVKSSVTTLSDKLDSTSSSQTVSYEYTDEDMANWRIQRPTRVTTSRSRTGQSSVSQITDTVYNTNGSIEQIIQQPDSSDASMYLQTFMRYDSKGNLVEQTQCSLHFAQSCGDTTVPGTHDGSQKVFRRKTFGYDSAGRYLTKISNPYYTEQSFHSFNKLGQPKEIRFNQYDSRAGQREHYRYDSFGERYFSYTNQGGSTKVTKQLCSNRSDCPANAAFAVVMSSPDQPNNITYIDNSGNKVREALQILDGRWSLTDTLYDSLSRPVKVSKPYIIGQTAYYDTLSYDALGRKDAVQSADDLITRFSYYAGKTTQDISGSYSDAASSANLDRTREEQHNGRGEVIYSTDSLGNNTYFTYTALGLPETVIGVDSAVTTLSYDSYGRRTGMDDPDKGDISYGFNAIGEDASRTSPDGVVKTHYRNAIGQIVSTNTVHGTSSLSYSFNYTNTPFIQQQSHNGSVTDYSYDSYHRPFTESYQLDDKSWSRTFYYDEYGRLFRDMDIAGNGHGQQYQYAYGHMNRIFEVKTGQAYYRMLEADAYQNLTQAEAANHIRVERDYDAKSGRLSGLVAGFGLIQHQYYRYDQLGNLRYRSDLNAFGSIEIYESMQYDQLNRLEKVFAHNGVAYLQLTYDDNGNILTKSDVERGDTYQYGSKGSSCAVTPGVHAVSQIGSRSFCYDARGNQTHRYVGSSLTRRVDYTAFDKPHTIWSNQGESRFNYDATEKLVKRTDKKAGGDMVTYYVGGHEAIFQPDGSSEIKRYIRDIAIHTIKSTGATTLHYVFNDHLGSGSVITDADGNVVEIASFDAFGKRRDAKLWGGYGNPFSQLPNLQALLNITQKGYTGHIQVDHASIIHMGGRIYDPDLGRFIQADPIVQDPRDAQSLNRYSYVYNNPLSYTDPTGYECQNQRDKACASALVQQKEDAAKAAQTQGSSKPEEVSQGNQSANLQNSAKVANGDKGFASFAWGMLKRGAHDTLTAAHEHIVGIPADKAGDPMGLRPQNATEAAGAAAYDDNALVINFATAALPGRQAALQKSLSEAVETVTKGADSKLSRSGAFKEAKQKADVPRSQQPDKVYREKIRDQGGHVEGRVYEFKRQDGSTVTIREHSLGHKLDNHGPHFNSEVRDADGLKLPLAGNGDSHTYFNR